MNCCPNCFVSPYLQNIIQSIQQKGNCSFCGSKDVNIYKASALLPFFRNIFDLYEVDSKSDTYLWQSIVKSFGIINQDNISSAKSLLESIASEEKKSLDTLFKNKVSSYDKNFSNRLSDIHSTWDSFKEEIKFKNRFHVSNSIDLTKLKDIFENEAFYKSIKERNFHRCRISDKRGFSKEEMGNPPKERTIDGRVNPKGISYLYLASDEKTALCETRANLLDYVAVGKFQLKQDIKVLDLRNPNYDIIPWSERDMLERFLTYGLFIKDLQREVSLPIRKQDKQFDYIPTQYISEYIKSLGFDGIEYRSSLNKDGYNLVIFNPNDEVIECIDIKVVEISENELKYNAV